MRRRIRITESQLRRTVNEAVRGLLREMDYKSPMSAGYKAANDGDYERARRFFDYGTDLANKQYGYEKNGKSVRYEPHLFKSVSASHTTPNGWGSLDDYAPLSDVENYSRMLRNGTVDRDTFNSTCGTLSAIRDYDKTAYDDMEDFYFDPRKFDSDYNDWRGAYDRAKTERDHYANGDYEYRKGQGWRLKNESRRRR